MGNPIVIPEIFKQGMEDFIIPTMVSAPNTTIQNRAMVSNSLKAIAGVERVMLKGLTLLSNEFGSNGQSVFETDSKDARVRFVGSGWISIANATGCAPSTTTVDDYFEITFYGTGLNLLTRYISSIDFRVSVDGGAEGSNIFVASLSSFLDGRNYGTNQVISIVQDLSVGWHTVKFRNATSSSTFYAYGFEVINARSDISVSSGAAISNSIKQSLVSELTSTFKKKVTGSKGARIVKYIENNKLKTVVQEVDSVSKYLTNTDHANEDVVRRINYREFGTNRSDDFSTLAAVTSDRFFTLDDGTTTLVGNDVQGLDAGLELFPNVANGFITLTFVGTGLDIFRIETATATTGVSTVYVDGFSVGNLSTTSVAGKQYVVKICSGLPYGTHTVKINRDTLGSAYWGIKDFIIYQPKKPSIPEGTFEVADYNVMADYVGSFTANAGDTSNGIIRKMSQREFIYSGTWAQNGIDVISNNGAITVQTNTAGTSLELTFFGTGVEIHTYVNINSQSYTFSIDGSTNISSFTTSVVTPATGWTWNTNTGVFSGTIVGGGNTSFRINNLPIGTHKIKVTLNSGTFYADSIDIITPIHINEPSLKIGSQSLRSNQNYDVIKDMQELGPDLSEAKAWFVWDSTNTKIVSSHNISAILATGAGSGHVYFEKPFKRDDYIAIGSANNVDSNIVTFTTKRANSILVQTTTNAGALNHNFVACVFFGELIDE